MHVRISSSSSAVINGNSGHVCFLPSSPLGTSLNLKHRGWREGGREVRRCVFKRLLLYLRLHNTYFDINSGSPLWHTLHIVPLSYGIPFLWYVILIIHSIYDSPYWWYILYTGMIHISYGPWYITPMVHHTYSTSHLRYITPTVHHAYGTTLSTQI